MGNTDQSEPWHHIETPRNFFGISAGNPCETIRNRSSETVSEFERGRRSMNDCGISKTGSETAKPHADPESCSEQGPISRVDISAILGITRAAVTIITNEMIDQHILQEVGEEPVKPQRRSAKGQTEDPAGHQRNLQVRDRHLCGRKRNFHWSDHPERGGVGQEVDHAQSRHDTGSTGRTAGNHTGKKCSRTAV